MQFYNLAYLLLYILTYLCFIKAFYQLLLFNLFYNNNNYITINIYNIYIFFCLSNILYNLKTIKYIFVIVLELYRKKLFINIK